MPPKLPVDLRDATPFIRVFRDFLIGRRGKNPLRFAPAVAARTQPPPDLPEGPAHRLSNNYYYLHDSRREMIPPLTLADNSTKAIESGVSGVEVGAKKAPRPGTVYLWD